MAIALALAASWLTERAGTAQPIRTSKLQQRSQDRRAADHALGERLGLRISADPALTSVEAKQSYSPESIAALEAERLGPSWGRPRRRR